MNQHMYREAEALRKDQDVGHLGGFFVVGNSEFNQFQINESQAREPTGWKFHLSVAPEDIEKATDILCNIYQRHQANSFKVTRPSTIPEYSNPVSGQAGKIFTLYDCGEPNWREILGDIESQFNHEGIKPSHVVKGDKPIKGSSYTYYRNDGSFRGIHMTLTAPQVAALPLEDRYNPLHVPDPFQSIDLRASSRFRIDSEMPKQSEKAYYRFAIEPSVAEAIKGHVWHETTRPGRTSPSYQVNVASMPYREQMKLMDVLRGEGFNPYKSNRRSWIEPIKVEDNLERFQAFLNQIGAEIKQSPTPMRALQKLASESQAASSSKTLASDAPTNPGPLRSSHIPSLAPLPAPIDIPTPVSYEVLHIVDRGKYVGTELRQKSGRGEGPSPIQTPTHNQKTMRPGKNKPGAQPSR